MSKEFLAARSRGHEHVHDRAREDLEPDTATRLPRRYARERFAASAELEAPGSSARAIQLFGDAVNTGIHPPVADGTGPSIDASSRNDG